MQKAYWYIKNWTWKKEVEISSYETIINVGEVMLRNKIYSFYSLNSIEYCLGRGLKRDREAYLKNIVLKGRLLEREGMNRERA